jgi:hypothetical protein
MILYDIRIRGNDWKTGKSKQARSASKDIMPIS